MNLEWFESRSRVMNYDCCKSPYDQGLWWENESAIESMSSNSLSRVNTSSSKKTNKHQTQGFENRRHKENLAFSTIIPNWVAVCWDKIRVKFSFEFILSLYFLVHQFKQTFSLPLSLIYTCASQNELSGWFNLDMGLWNLIEFEWEQNRIRFIWGKQLDQERYQFLSYCISLSTMREGEREIFCGLWEVGRMSCDILFAYWAGHQNQSRTLA